MNIYKKKRKIRNKRLIFYPILIVIFLIILNIFLKPICLTNSSSPTITEITGFDNPVCKYVPRWFNYITPSLNFKDLRTEIIKDLIVIGLLYISASQLGKANKENNRIRKLKQDVDDEKLKDELRNNY